jgi:hypothetical protein
LQARTKPGFYFAAAFLKKKLCCCLAGIAFFSPAWAMPEFHYLKATEITQF